MEKKASVRFIVSAVIWVIAGKIATELSEILFDIILLPGWGEYTPEVNPGVFIGMLLYPVIAFSYWGAGFFSLKYIKKHFPDLENVKSLKKTATIFFGILLGAGIIRVPVIFVDMVFRLVFNRNIIINGGMSEGSKAVTYIILILEGLVYILVPLIMIPYCRKKIPKLYNSHI